MSDYLVGYKFGIVWGKETSIEEYTIVKSGADISKNEVNIDTPFVKSIIGINQGEESISQGNKFLIKYIICPNFNELCIKRNIQYLYHFSSIENIDSIMQYGILSKNALINYGIEHDFNDVKRWDNHEDYISLSVEYPNGKLLKYFKNKFNKKFVIFKIKINVLNYKEIKCSEVNAATNAGAYIENLNRFYILFSGVRVGLPDSFPTNEQAEILVKDKIEVEYIDQIIFETEEDELKYKNKYNTIVNGAMFKYRDEYLKSNLNKK